LEHCFRLIVSVMCENHSAQPVLRDDALEERAAKLPKSRGWICWKTGTFGFDVAATSNRHRQLPTATQIGNELGVLAALCCAGFVIEVDDVKTHVSASTQQRQQRDAIGPAAYSHRPIPRRDRFNSGLEHGIAHMGNDMR
jgi:hypothetical protein